MKVLHRILALGALLWLILPDPLAAQYQRTLAAEFSVLVGFPSRQQSSAAVPFVVPGEVIPIGTEARANEGLGKTVAHARVVEKLWATFRLDPARQLQKSVSGTLSLGKPFALPAVDNASVTITATLASFNERFANYRVVFRQAEKVLADSMVNVAVGGRAVVGGMDGEAAPYIFVIIEPEFPGATSTPDVTHPVELSKVPIEYPEEVRKEKITGMVVLEVTIDENGKVGGIMALESPDPRLSRAAIASVSQWTFQPARKSDGTPVAVRSTISVNFVLR